MIEVCGLSKSYRDFMAIQDIDFKVAAGEVVGLLGPNGAGKTTTMKILTGSMPPSAGSASIGGFDIFEQPMQVRRCIGYLPEVPPVYPDLTVHEYLRFIGRLKGLAGRELVSDIERVVNRTHVVHEVDRLIRNLSKGYQQRVGLAQALLGDPQVLILDEPTVGLDPRQIGDVRRLIRSLAGEHTVLLSTHILQEVAAICERVIIMKQGQIVADDRIESLLKKHQRDDARVSLEEIFLALTEL